MNNRITYKELEKKVKFCLKYKIPYKKIMTNGRTVLLTKGWGDWETKENRFPANELHFIKSVKDHIIKNGTYKKIRNYFKTEVKPGDIFNEGYEVDISNCYWDTAYFHYNLFDEPIYLKGLTVVKRIRLAAIGSLKRVQSVIEFDGKEEKQMPDIRSTTTEFLWDTICHKIGKTMYKSSKEAGKGFLFFWVDGLFVKDKSTAIKVQKFLKKNGYNSTIALCEWIRFDEKSLVVKSTAKGKFVTVIREEEVIRNGKKFIKIHRDRVWKDERPFPYSSAISEKDIINLNIE